MKKQWMKLLASLIICFLPAISGLFFMTDSINGWYMTLNKPWFTPPNWIFAPVWTILYLLMGISLYLIWKEQPMLLVFRREKRDALMFFSIQLSLNFLWTPIFFTFHIVWLAFIIIFCLIAVLTVTIFVFHDINKTAAYLLIPYLLWLGIAGPLNFAVLLLN